MWARALVAVGLVACGARVDVGGGDGPPPTPDGASSDAPPGIDAMLGVWGPPTLIPTAGTAGLEEDDGSPDATETELLFSGRPTGGVKNIYRLARPTTLDPWGVAALVGELNTAQTDQTPRLSADGLTVYFASNRAGGLGSDDIWMATRANRASPFVGLALVPAVSSAQSERTFTPCAGNRYVVISFRTGMGDVYEGTLGSAPVLVASVSDPAATETGTYVSADCTQLWFASNRDGSTDIFHAVRAAPTDAWGAPTKVTELSLPGVDESDPWVSSDGRRMVFASDADGELDQYMSVR